MQDLLIKNAQIIDGTGKPAFRANVGVKGKKIDFIGTKLLRAAKTLDANGRSVVPGFIDAQNHADSFWTIFDYPHQDSMLLQGITTIAVGQSGASLAPLPSQESFKATQKWHSLAGVNFNWQYFDEFLSEIERHENGVNILSLVGHSTIRRGLVGDEIRNITEPELKLLARLAISSLKTGAFGISMGLQYAHEYNSSSEELLMLAQIAAESGTLLSVQLRDYGTQILEAFDEVIDMGHKTGARLKISHLKIEGNKNWHLIKQLTEKLNKAHALGVKMFFDVYPYTTSWKVLYTYLPKWAYEGGRSHLLERLEEPYSARKIAQALADKVPLLSQIIIAHASTGKHLIGKSLAQVAKSQNNSIAESLISILRTNASDVIVFDNNVSEEQLYSLISHPLSIVASDGAGFDFNSSQFDNIVHPRCFGTMPKFLSEILKRKILSLEGAIRKITSMPAELYGLSDRGVLAVGRKADIVMFSPEKLADNSTLKNPFRKPSGIEWVMVNGTETVVEGELSENFSGKVLRYR